MTTFAVPAWTELLRQAFAIGRPPDARPLADRFALVSASRDDQLWRFRLRWREPDGGRSADLALRVYRDRGVAGRCRNEIAALDLAAELELHAPLVWLAEPAAAQPYLVVDWVPGESFAGAWNRRRPDATPDVLAVTLADLHASTERRDRQSAARDVGDLVQAIQSCVREAGLRPLSDALARLMHAPPAPESSSLCHGSYRPRNVLLRPGARAVIVGWSRAAIGDTRLDLARASLCIGEELGGALRTPFLRSYRGERSIEPELLAWFEALAGIERAMTLLRDSSESDHAARLTFALGWIEERVCQV